MEEALPSDLISLISLYNLDNVYEICRASTDWRKRCDTQYFKGQLIDKYVPEKDKESDEYEDFKSLLISIPIYSLINILISIEEGYPSRIFSLIKEDKEVNRLVENNIFKRYFSDIYLYHYTKGESLDIYEMEKLSLILYPDILRIDYYSDILNTIEGILGEDGLMKAYEQIMYEFIGGNKYRQEDIKNFIYYMENNGIVEKALLNIWKIGYEMNNESFRGTYFKDINSYTDLQRIGNEAINSYWIHIDNNGKLLLDTWDHIESILDMYEYSANPMYWFIKYKEDILNIYRKRMNDAGEGNEKFYYFIMGYDRKNIRIPGEYLFYYSLGTAIYLGETIAITRKLSTSIGYPLETLIQALAPHNKILFYTALCKCTAMAFGEWNIDIDSFSSSMKILPKSSRYIYRVILRYVEKHIATDIWDDIAYRNIYSNVKYYGDYVLMMLYANKYIELWDYLITYIPPT
ncbi:Hypothetical protein ORPV_48 [Orpheovirus IHUMI-LCC2]|uniref:Uncharacterized protein n=1 Tax=Orpheovirus IHUMI-LCC2 TaxID=2023057 RepID=A0A2I2L340_9VIRU|nr:Hypothetical protein ORPV_48 [Orpheovirus IHUMI-LCC2]SNW61952.1 Hypothetical protein ORPV_48 [Orpheovirus IHUMI-LCC2]